MFGPFGTDSSCSSLAPGASCSTTTLAANPCISPGPIEFYCPAGNKQHDTKPFLASSTITCQPCAVTARPVDLDPDEGRWRGIITWGPNMRAGVIDESFLTGYKVAVVDSCGQVLPGAEFLYMRKHGLSDGCCRREAYTAMWSVTLPERYSHFMIVPYSDDWGEQDGGPLIAIADNINGTDVDVEVPRSPLDPRGVTSGSWRWEVSTWLCVLAVAALAS